MTAQTVAQTIQLIIAPVVMVTSCAVLVNGILSRYLSVGDRLRLMTHERLDLLRRPDGTLDRPQAEADQYKAERLSEIDRQMPALLSRHELLHNATLMIYQPCQLRAPAFRHGGESRVAHRATRN
jgi:hypothetical protein